MRAAIYARVSTDRQSRDQTIDSQLAALRQWARDGGHDLRPEHTFTDDGYSGARLDRPALDRLRDAAHQGGVEVIAVYSPDRLARKYAYQALLLEEFRKAGCEVAFIQRPISDDPHDQLLLQIQGAIAEYEKAVLGERFRRGKLQKARAGQWVTSKAPYGYRYVPKRDGVPGHLAIEPAEAEVVRMLYDWLIDERMTVRQILKRLAAGPWRPRNGKRRWSNSVVHRLLSDSTYTGTAYANRYTYVVPRKPRSRGPRAGEATCRKPRPRADWIPIPVPAIIDESTHQNALAQLARNAVLSFRRNTRHTYLLRCLLTCRTCGLAMFGITQRNKAGVPAHRYYTCHGKDTVARDRDRRCPQAPAKVEELDAAVWDHIRRLLDDPATLLAQFEALSRPAVGDPTGPGRWDAQLGRLDREEQRLLDAYQAEAIDLAELKDRRQQIAGRRQVLVAQREQDAQLRAERGAAQQVWADLAAFCARVRARLGEATLAERQQVLQLLVERVIVGEDQVEVRHVIPLRHLTAGADIPAPPDSADNKQERPKGSEEPAGQTGDRLRSDGVRPAHLVSPVRQVVVRRVPVAGHHVSVGRPDQVGEGRPRPTAGDPEDGGHGRDHHPQPAALAHPGLVHVGRVLPGGGQQGIHGRRQPLADGRLGGTHLGRTDGHPEQVGQQAGGLGLAQPEGPGQEGAGGPRARAVLAGHPGRRVPAGGGPAARTGQPVPAVLGDDRRDRRQFGHLVPQGFGVVPGQRPCAAAAGGRPAFVDVVRAIDQGPLVFRVAGLPAGLPPGLGLGRGPLDGRRIGRRRLRRVGRVLAEAGFQLGDPRLERRVLGPDGPDELDHGRWQAGEEFRW
jgi:site-specific DNA recombinase